MNDSYLDTLYTLAQELNTAYDIPTMLNAVVNHLPKVLGARYCSLFVRNPASGELEIKAHNHTDIGEDPFIHIPAERESVMNLVITRKSSLIIKDIEEEIGLRNKEKYKTKSFMCIMIKHDDDVIGVLNLADKSDGNFTKDDMLIASIISELLGALLARTDLNTL
ncbi:MAG TPA: GAF domain-containing protein [Deltaproteobacteria bacterium]|nr:GAF domain-containing protein [Spirochaetia bacterium]HQG31045.1 GAF domain-containing protein [Deltaproteobacteria bacterium]HQI00051.1 GAF domain-containing protein [Deltaproteobacteria bacterium]HQJ08686.1 GAF domain-containing protein [Deltaproteobacteria bacterium]